MLYRVREGMLFGERGQFGEGDEVEIDFEIAAAFADKLEEVERGDDVEIMAEFSDLSDSILAALRDADASWSDVAEMSDEELESIPGIGPSAVRKIRDAYTN